MHLGRGAHSLAFLGEDVPRVKAALLLAKCGTVAFATPRDLHATKARPHSDLLDTPAVFAHEGQRGRFDPGP